MSEPNPAKECFEQAFCGGAIDDNRKEVFLDSTKLPRELHGE